MINFESQRREFNIVISDLSRCRTDYHELLDYLGNNGVIYYAIVHDKDVQLSNGELIRPHLHIVTKSLKRYRVKQFINLLANCLITNLENIQIRECDNFVACVQYLIHKNDISKYQYSSMDILTNDHDGLLPILNETISVKAVTTDQLIEMVSRGDTLLEIIKAIGIGSYSHYRQTIQDLFKIFYH